MQIKISGFYDEYSTKLDDQITLIKKWGESYLCPRSVDGRSIASYSYEEFAKDIKPKLDAAGIKFSSIGSPIGKIGVRDEEGFERQKKQLKELIKIAVSMDCKYIRIFSFFPGKEEPAACRDTVMQKLKGFLEIAEGTGVILLHENEKKIYGDTDERCLDIYQTIRHPQLQLIYDASNFIQCKVDPVAAYNKLKDYVVYYHIKDCDWSSGVEMPVGFGDGHYKEMFADLKVRGYEGFMTMEPHTMKYAYLRQLVYFFPFLPLILNKFYKGFRRIDKKLGKSVFKKATREEVFELQYSNLTALLKEAGLQGE